MALTKDEIATRKATRAALDKEIADAEKDLEEADAKAKTPEQKDQVAKEKEKVEEAKKEAKRAGEIPAVSEDTAHALLEELRAARKERESKKVDVAKGGFWSWLWE